MFLALAYFGTDQSQVQRYLTGKSVTQSRISLLFNAVAKIPMQFFILFIGAIVFVFYIYEKPPLFFDKSQLTKLEATARPSTYQSVTHNYDDAFERRKSAADRLIAARHQGDARGAQAGLADYNGAQRDLDAARRDGAAILERSDGKKFNDTNYIFLSFVTRYLPAGLVGLILAVILGATMSSISAEMNSLATVSVIDIYKRHFRPAASDRHYLMASRAFTLFWGGYAVLSAQYAKRLGSLIEAVNLLGSFFYGGMLGVFVLAFFFPRVRARGAFWGALAGEASIFGFWYFTNIAFLWYNVIGCMVVVGTGVLISKLDRAVPA